MGLKGLSKNDRGGLQLAKYNVGPAVSAIKTNGKLDEYNKAYDQGLYGKCWRMILATGLKLDGRGAK